MAARAILCRHWAEGGAGAVELAEAVAALADDGAAQFAPLYDDDLPLFDKIDTVATRIYRAEDAVAEPSVLRAARSAGRRRATAICRSAWPRRSTASRPTPPLLGAPTGHVVPVREVRLAAGAGFVVAICGEIMTMPGLPRVPAAEAIRLDDDGLIEGLF